LLRYISLYITIL